MGPPALREVEVEVGRFYHHKAGAAEVVVQHHKKIEAAAAAVVEEEKEHWIFERAGMDVKVHVLLLEKHHSMEVEV